MITAGQVYNSRNQLDIHEDPSKIEHEIKRYDPGSQNIQRRMNEKNHQFHLIQH